MSAPLRFVRQPPLGDQNTARTHNTALPPAAPTSSGYTAVSIDDCASNCAQSQGLMIFNPTPSDNDVNIWPQPGNCLCVSGPRAHRSITVSDKCSPVIQFDGAQRSALDWAGPADCDGSSSVRPMIRLLCRPQTHGALSRSTSPTRCPGSVATRTTCRLA